MNLICISLTPEDTGYLFIKKKKKKFFLATSCGIQGLNSPNEDQTRAPGIGSTESTTGRPGNSLVISLKGSWPHILSVKSQLVSFADASPGLFVV